MINLDPAEKKFEDVETTEKKHSPVWKQLPKLPARLALSSAFTVHFYYYKNSHWLCPDLTIIGI